MIDMVESGATMYSSHSCKKTPFVKDRLGQLVSITTEALYVKTANQDRTYSAARNATQLASE
jgi:hypothetical protein